VGELFSDASAKQPGLPGKAKAREPEEDPFAALGEIDPAMLPAPGEATRFFIEQAGVHKRNPPWKIAAFIAIGLGLPIGILYALSVTHLVPLEVTRVDEHGNEVKASVFSASGVSGLTDLLTGKRPKANSAPKPGGAHRPSKAEPVEQVRDLKLRSARAPSRQDLAALYGDTSKVDRGPRVRKNAELREKDSSTGGLSAESVSKVVAQSQPAFQQCIEQELRKNPNFRGGKINIIATVGSSGLVKRAEIDRKDIDLSNLGGCLKARAKRMQFPSFSGDEETEVHMPLILGATL
jgi:hypothetical protein